VADLAREAVRARLHTALDADRARDTGAEGDEEKAVGSSARADAALGEAAGADVVAERDRGAEALAEQVAQGEVAPAEVGRVGGDAVPLVDDAGDGDAGRGRGLAEVLDAVGAQFGGEVEDALDHRVGAALAAGGAAGAMEQLAARADEGGLHPGAAHIEGDDMSHGGQCGPRTRKRSSPLTWCRPIVSTC